MRALWRGFWRLGTQTVLGLTLGIASATGFCAETPEAAPVDPTGVWVWTLRSSDVKPAEARIRLRWTEGRLAGEVTGRDGKAVPLETPKLEGNRITFAVTRTVSGKKFTTQYEGRIEGDRMKGKAEMGRAGHATSREWTAERVKDR